MRDPSLLFQHRQKSQKFCLFENCRIRSLGTESTKAHKIIYTRSSLLNRLQSRWEVLMCKLKMSEEYGHFYSHTYVFFFSCSNVQLERSGIKSLYCHKFIM